MEFTTTTNVSDDIYNNPLIQPKTKNQNPNPDIPFMIPIAAIITTHRRPLQPHALCRNTRREGISEAVQLVVELVDSH